MKVLLVPLIRASMGSGHLKRAVRLAEVFGADSAVLLEDGDRVLGSRSGGAGSNAGALLESLGVAPSTVRFVDHVDPQERWDLVIVDRRSSAVEHIQRFFPAPVVGLDEGGKARRYCSYLIDTFPVPDQPHRANLAALSLLDLPERRPPERRPPERRLAAHQSRDCFPVDKVLISFGGEDPADLSHRLLTELLRCRLFKPEQITVVQGPFFRRERWPEKVTVLLNPADLKSMLAEYDLLFCSFGLTTYEALAAGVPVIHLNPSRYHRRLSNAAELPEIGIRRPVIGKLRRLLAEPRRLENLLSRYPQETFSRPPRLTELPTQLQPSGTADCPVCTRTTNPGVARFVDRSYFRCRDCGIIYLIVFGAQSVPGLRYDEEYFFAEYRKQYGKTYLEDFETIKGLAASRLKHIRQVSQAAVSIAVEFGDTAPAEFDVAATASPPAPGPRLLDLGCAYGPFLEAAAEWGYRVHGSDVSQAAVRYVREQLGFPCGLGDFSSPDWFGGLTDPETGFDILTMWYVIEHFRDTGTVLGRVNRLLKPGGVFAFSTPSAAGISARKSAVQFLENSPRDHYTVWSPRTVAGILRRYGFRLRKIVVTGHHGDRFPWPVELASDSTITAGFNAVSRLLRLGDTFEAYAVKVRNLP